MGIFSKNFGIRNKDEARKFITSLGLLCTDGVNDNTLYGFMNNPYLGTRDIFINENGLVLIWDSLTDGTFRVSTTIHENKAFDIKDHTYKYVIDFRRGFSPKTKEDLIDALNAIQDNLKYRIQKEYNEQIDEILEVLP